MGMLLCLRCNFLNTLFDDRQFRSSGCFLLNMGGTAHRLSEQARHQSIGEHLSVRERVGLTKNDLQYSGQGAVVINRQDKERPGSELPANCRFNPPVGLCVLDPQNLVS
jgi:hypothetical protein